MVVALNFDLTTKINELMEEKESSLRKSIESSQEVEEFKDELSQWMRLMKAEIEQKDKALEIMKNKELEHIARLSKRSSRLPDALSALQFLQQTSSREVHGSDCSIDNISTLRLPPE
ncbi:hypothetical protein QYF36_019583 [Acer negundo]|nr:hypothetical protein QYF36_019583 [Acer negundo]